MSLLLKLLPFKWWIVGGAFAAVLGFAGLQTLRLTMSHADLASAIALRAQEREHAAEAARIQSEEYRLEDQRRAKAIRSIVDETVRISSEIATDAAAARASADRLRDRIAAVVAASRKASRDPAAPPGSQAAPDSPDLLADVFRRVDEVAGQLAQLADERGTAGNACERAYGALTK